MKTVEQTDKKELRMIVGKLNQLGDLFPVASEGVEVVEGVLQGRVKLKDVKHANLYQAFIGAVEAIPEQYDSMFSDDADPKPDPKAKALWEEVIKFYNVLTEEDKEEPETGKALKAGKKAGAKAAAAPKGKKADDTGERSIYGNHKLDCAGGLMDDLIHEGGTLDVMAKAFSNKYPDKDVDKAKGILKVHINWLKGKHGIAITLDEKTGVYKGPDKV